jgi:hypothetical protein
MRDPKEDAEEIGEKIGEAVLSAITKSSEYANMLIDEETDPKNTLLVSLARVHFLYVSLVATARGVLNDDDLLKNINETVLQTMLYSLKGRIDAMALAEILKTDLPLITPEFLDQISEDEDDIMLVSKGSKTTH